MKKGREIVCTGQGDSSAGFFCVPSGLGGLTRVVGGPRGVASSGMDWGSNVGDNGVISRSSVPPLAVEEPAPLLLLRFRLSSSALSRRRRTLKLLSRLAGLLSASPSPRRPCNMLAALSATSSPSLIAGISSTRSAVESPPSRLNPFFSVSSSSPSPLFDSLRSGIA